MRITVRSIAAGAMMTAMAGAVPAEAQRYHDGHVQADVTVGQQKNVRLHVNPRWKECSFQLDAALTQKAWRQFTGEAAVVSYFRPLVDAKPMGRGQFEISMLQWSTDIDDTEAAWNDTFVHPDSTHWLMEGSSLAFPGLTARVGVTDRTDFGLYFTKSPGANYGFYGVQMQQGLLDNNTGPWELAGRVSYSGLYGPEDVSFGVMGADLLASRRIGLLGGRVAVSPYAGMSATLARSHEKSAVTNVKDENVLGAMGTVGATAEFSGIRLAAEYTVARVPSMSLKIGFGR